MSIEITSSDELKAYIHLLAQRDSYLKNEIERKFHGLSQEARPANLLRGLTKNIHLSPLAKNSIGKIFIGLGVGYYLKRKFTGKSTNIVRKIAGTALQLAFASLVGRKLSPGSKILSKVFSRRSPKA